MAGRVGALVALVLAALLAATGTAAAATTWSEEFTVAKRDWDGVGADIALAPNGDAVALFESFGRPLGSGQVALFSEDRGKFTHPQRIGEFQTYIGPTVDREGTAWVLVDRGSGRLAVVSRPPGGEFGSPVDLEQTGDIDRYHLAVSPTGDVFVYWSDFFDCDTQCSTTFRVAVRRHDTGQFEPAQTLAGSERSTSYHRIAFDAAGNALLAWRSERNSRSEAVIEYATRRAGAPAFGPVRELTPLGRDHVVKTLALASNASGRAVAVWVARERPRRAVQAALGTVAGGFGAPTLITDGRAAYPRVAVDGGGEVLAAWNTGNTKGVDLPAAVRAAVAPPGGEFGGQRAIRRGPASPPIVVKDGAGTFTIAWRLRVTNRLEVVRRAVGSESFAVERPTGERVSRFAMKATADHRTLLVWNVVKDKKVKRLEASVAGARGAFAEPRTLDASFEADRSIRPLMAVDREGGAFVSWQPRSYGLPTVGRFLLPR